MLQASMKRFFMCLRRHYRYDGVSFTSLLTLGLSGRNNMAKWLQVTWRGSSALILACRSNACICFCPSPQAVEEYYLTVYRHGTFHYSELTVHINLTLSYPHFKRFSQNCGKRLLASPCPSVCPHGTTTRLQMDAFSWNLIFEYFSKICQKNLKSFIQIWQE